MAHDLLKCWFDSTTITNSSPCGLHDTLQCIQLYVPRQFTVHVVLWRIDIIGVTNDSVVAVSIDGEHECTSHLQLHGRLHRCWCSKCRGLSRGCLHMHLHLSLQAGYSVLHSAPPRGNCWLIRHFQEVAPGSRGPGRGSLARHCLLHHTCCIHVHLQSSHVASPLASVTVTQHLAIHNTCPARLIEPPNRDVALHYFQLRL